MSTQPTTTKVYVVPEIPEAMLDIARKYSSKVPAFVQYYPKEQPTEEDIEK
jgi:hypothetical protein